MTASSVRAVAAVTWGPVCHGRNRDRRERMLLDGSAVSAASRNGKIRSDRLDQLPPKGGWSTGSFLPGRRLPVIGNIWQVSR